MRKQTFSTPPLCSALLAASIGVTGCSGRTDAAGCTVTGFQLSADAADNRTPDHSLAAPANQEQYLARQGALTGPGCVTPQVLATVHAQWSTSDPKNVTASSIDDATNGLATCLGATTATITATSTQGGFTRSSTSPITCR